VFAVAWLHTLAVTFAYGGAFMAITENLAPAAVQRAATTSAHSHLDSKPAVLSLEQSTVALLDRTMVLVHAGDALAAFRLLGVPLSALWSEARACDRADEMLAWCRQHPFYALAQQDPFTHRAVTKPRGYAGDAVMMDYIYQGTPPDGTSALGSTTYAATTGGGMGLSVRYRRQLLKSLINDTAVLHNSARMLSVASGHCRELEGSYVDSALFKGQFVALDQDPLSGDEVRRVHQNNRVTVLTEGVRDLMSPTRSQSFAQEHGPFDLIYSAGLYDYLPDALAKSLTSKLLSMLAPGGRLVIANFVPQGSGRGYMELFMDWTLILRTEAQLRELSFAAGAAQVNSFLDPHRNVAYAELVREPTV
jgi:extracellular factor (EF) 3-hydroxypalmitic acid methyl ester biosynthesis protein